MEKNEREQKDSESAVKHALNELRQTSRAFIKAPQALWGINIPYLLEGIVYFGILTELEIFSSTNLAVTDFQANWILSFLTGGITLAMVILGSKADDLGIRKSLTLAFSTMLVGRVILALSGTLALGQGMFSPMFFVMILGLFFVIIGYGLYQPAAYAGIKRYTTPETKSMGYAVVYSLMNLGAFIFGASAPFIRKPFIKIFPPNGITAVFWALAGINVLALLFTITLLTKKADKEAYREAKSERDKEKDETQEDESAATDRDVDNRFLIFSSVLTGAAIIAFIIFKSGGLIGQPDSLLHNLIYTTLIVLFGFLSIRDYLKRRPEHPFHDSKFVFFIFILIPVQTLFAHNWLTIPPYIHRAFQDNIAQYYEFFTNINPLLIFFLAPLIAGLTKDSKIYKMVIIGTSIMALPTFLLIFEPNIYLFLTFILFVTIGEAIWQPRFLEWIAEMAPEDKTGAYMGIGQLPWFLTKVVTGLYAGFFLEKYCPQPNGAELQPGKMWLFHALIAIITPIALILAKNWMTQEETTN